MAKKDRDITGYLIYTARLISKSRYRDLFAIKGCIALDSVLMEIGREDLGRATFDIDIHCNNKEVWEMFCKDVEFILNNNDRGFIYRLNSRKNTFLVDVMYDRLVFELQDCSNIIKFKMDMNIKPNNIISVSYSNVIGMHVYDLYTMVSDKIVAVSSSYIHRRVKDLYDIVALFSLNPFSYREIWRRLEIKYGKNLTLRNMLVNENFANLRHAYSDLRFLNRSINFETLIRICMNVLSPFYNNMRCDLLWDVVSMSWIRL